MRDFIIPQYPPGDDRDMGTPAKVGLPVTLTVDGFGTTSALRYDASAATVQGTSAWR